MLSIWSVGDSDSPLASVVLLPRDIAEQRWLTRQESKDNPQDVVPGAIEQVRRDCAQ